ncbi:hypothetical protein CWI37_0115p0010 [Hamiltosporidium tvaerminnensis]|uniref:Uncharacterized protein n=1 Tax=Hamiltosporidium tvaerminnensis TaxID=1176355 RepID=A0A4Q9LA32_9MICR|nr:hypothetical protein CWI37_0115p0010 [Hamiltosporidium tvaerminnensis]
MEDNVTSYCCKPESSVFSGLKEDLCFADIQTFVSGDLYIDSNNIQKDLKQFPDSIDSVAEKENFFWMDLENMTYLFI